MSSEYPVVFSFNGVEHHVEIQSARDLVARINRSLAAAIEPTPTCAEPKDVAAIYDEADKRWSEASDFIAQFLVCPTLEDIALCRDMLEVQRTQLATATEAAEAGRSQLAVAVEHLDAMTDAVIWMSGSSDFSKGGSASEGWEKVRPKLFQAIDALRELRAAKEGR